MPNINLNKDRGAIVAAALGATGALALALVVNPLVLLAAEAIAVGGAYAYSKAIKQNKPENDTEAEHD